MRKSYCIVECLDMIDDGGASLVQNAALAAERLLADIQKEKLELAGFPPSTVAGGAEALDAVALAARQVLTALRRPSQLNSHRST